MAGPADPTDPKRSFLDTKDAEIVHGSDVIADKVADAMRDADRFGLPDVKPPLSEALHKAKHADETAEEVETIQHNALAGAPSKVHEDAGSAEMLIPEGAAHPT